MKIMENAVGYLRVSTNMQIDGYSLESQYREIQEYCKRNNLNLIKKYEDAGLSGTTTEDRIEFNQLLTDIEENNKNVKTIVAYKLSRISRNVRDVANLVDFLERNDVNLICIQDNIDTRTPMGKVFVYLAAVFAEMERDNIVEFGKMGMKQRALNGYSNGGKAFGYKSVNKELVIIEEHAEVIREIFNKYLDGWGYKKIAMHFTNIGVKTLKDNEWTITGIKQVLDNPLYAGLIQYGKYKDWDKKRRSGKQENPIIVEGRHQAIISMETWENTQQLRKIKSKMNTRDTTPIGDFLLTGLLKCPTCGASMISCQSKKKNKKNNTEKVHKYYQCSVSFNKGSQVCKTNLMRKTETEEYVFNRIKEIVKQPEIVEAIINKSKQETDIDVAPLKENLKKLEKELEKIKKKKDENLELEFKGDIDIDMLQQRLVFLKKKEQEVLNQILNIEEKIDEADGQGCLNADIIGFALKNFVGIFGNADIGDKKALYNSIIESISVNPGNTPSQRTINKIKLYFQPQDIDIDAVVKKDPKKFPIICDTVHLSLS